MGCANSTPIDADSRSSTTSPQHARGGHSSSSHSNHNGAKSSSRALGGAAAKKIRKKSPDNSKNKNTASGNTNKQQSPYETVVPTRPRMDSWALNNAPPSPKSSPSSSSFQQHQHQHGGSKGDAALTMRSNNNHVNHHGTASSTTNKNNHRATAATTMSTTPVTSESQWKALWETHSPLLVDPQDVAAVMDGLMNRIVNQLSPVEVTLLQRRIRSAVRSLPNPGDQSKMGRVFSSSANMVETEAKNVATSQHLLTEYVVLNKIFKYNVVVGTTNVQQNAYTLMLYLSDTLWPRVASVASHTAEQAQLVLDVNQQTPDWNARMPKPSIVPDVTEAPDLPPGVSPQALCCIVALARAASRAQRLQLLFYLCLDATFLADFLAKHPAGGPPCWLLEVDQEQVVSLASLTHYHYYGNAFLPCDPARHSNRNTNGSKQSSSSSSSSSSSTTTTPTLLPPFVPSKSKSRIPLYVAAATVHRVVSVLLAGHTVPSTAASESNGATTRRSSFTKQKNTSNGTSTTTATVPMTTTTTNTTDAANATTTTLLIDGLVAAANGPSATASSGIVAPLTAAGSAASGTMSTVEPDTQLMRALHLQAESGTGARVDYLDKSLDGLAETLLQQAQLTTDHWTLTEFRSWADQVLTDQALDACFHELFGKGILPGPWLEKRLVQHEWLEWQRWAEEELAAVPTERQAPDAIAQSVRAAMWDDMNTNGGSSAAPTASRPFGPTALPWGRLGGLDGAGGLGRGILYCIDKKWWNAWADYVGWTWVGQKPSKRRKSLQRPGLISNEILIENDSEIVTRGSLGSFEMMKKGLKKNRDYVLVPPGVWSILYELYSGGPPLPRMILPPERKASDMSTRTDRSGGDDDLDAVMEDLGRDIRVTQISDLYSVATNPWILQCSLCDPQQPYRRGDAGHVNIRVQVMPYQPLWRLVAEIFSRFPLGALNAFEDGVCKGRLWKRMDPLATKEAMPRYGPWLLLCKNREARFPLLTGNYNWRSYVEKYLVEWQEYSEDATVESIGLQDGAILMLEVAVLNKAGELIWPREAAAKAGRVKRLADEDKQFRNTLQGLDKDGNVLLKPPKLVGMNVDAMDGTGRWHHATIVDVDVVDEDTEVEEEDNEDGDGKTSEPVSRKKVKVTFKDTEGHYAWIDVESDRLAKSGRFTNDTDDQSTSPSTKGNSVTSPKESETKSKVSTNLVKKASNAGDNSNHGNEGSAVNPFPGLGACGLTNLGNTCYQNSAIQCMGYTPLLRAYLLSSQYKTDINKDNPLGTGGKLLEEIAELLRVIWSARQGEKTPTRFRTQLGRMNSQFAGADQQDAQEFLNYMLDVLHEDSNRVRQKPYVPALEDSWLQRTSLQRIGDEAWRRFLRRNQSIMANVGMGQVLNTVTCPVCNFSSRNFDPFNLLSVTIPTVSDVIFQVIVFRRASFANNSWVLNRPGRKDDKRSFRFLRKNSKVPTGPPSDTYVAEQYVITMSRLADSSDLRLQIQNVCNIPGGRLKLCRAEEVIDEEADPNSIFRQHIEMIPLTEKEGPCSQLARKKLPDEEIAAPTLILAFESTLRPRPMKKGKEDDQMEDTADEDEEEVDHPGPRPFPSPDEERKILRSLESYGDTKECRFYDTDPHVLAQAVSRSIWPKSDDELRFRKGLRVDAKDSRGSWYPGSIIEVLETEVTVGNVDTGEQTKVKKTKAVVHFDNFSPKWDEEYSLADFEAGKVQPLYTYAKPKPRPTEFLVHHRHFDSSSEKFLHFGQSFYIQCHNEWTTARAAAQILAQASRFVRRGFDPLDTDDTENGGQDEVLIDQLERCHIAMSALIDLLIDCDREFVSRALGVDNSGDESRVSFQNRDFDPSKLIRILDKNAATLLEKIPFEILVATQDISPGTNKTAKLVDEKPFPLSLLRTMGNFMHVRQAIVLRWRIPKRTDSTRPPLILYCHPSVEIHKPGMEVLKMVTKVNKEKARRTGKSSGIDLGVCLTEFCKMQKLSMDDNWRCPKCKEFREGQQSMNLWRLPDFLTFHIKRFNMSARWREKLTTKINFPLTGLNMSEWCHNDSPAIQVDGDDSHVYDLIGVVNHYGSMTGGHYVAFCKATACGKEGREEAAYGFNGFGANALESEGNDTTTGWRLGRPKAETNFQKEAAQVAARAAAESAEPLWLQFDDELVEPMPPRNVVSEMAYVLFYRRRRINPSNIARYSTLD